MDKADRRMKVNRKITLKFPARVLYFITIIKPYHYIFIFFKNVRKMANSSFFSIINLENSSILIVLRDLKFV